MRLMKNILIVEDDPFVRKFYQDLFSHQPYSIEFAADGAEGIAKALSLLPDLILLDIMMPKMNGLEVLKTLKEDPKTKHIQIIMLTNFGEEKYVQQASQYGASAFLLKVAYSPKKLVAEVEKYIGQKNASS